MYSALTEDIRVTVRADFSEAHSTPEISRYFWTYAIDIVNQGKRTVQLLRRRWTITDALGHTEIVEGPGVVGEQPRLEPGHRFSYVSGCPLSTPSGSMVGVYQMIDDQGRLFNVEIPAFSLDSEYLRRTLN
jgi:ApaG protein